MYYITRFLFGLFQLIFTNFRVMGRENLNDLQREGKGIIVIANHCSELDPWAIAYACRGRIPAIHYFAKKELFFPEERKKKYQPKVGLVVASIVAWLSCFVVKRSLTIPVDRENDSARINRLAIISAKKILSEGGVVGIFGQGGRNRDDVKSISSKLALKTGAVTLPVKVGEGYVVIGEGLSSTLIKTMDCSDVGSAASVLRIIEALH